MNHTDRTFSSRFKDGGGGGGGGTSGGGGSCLLRDKSNYPTKIKGPKIIKKTSLYPLYPSSPPPFLLSIENLGRRSSFREED